MNFNHLFIIYVLCMATFCLLNTSIMTQANLSLPASLQPTGLLTSFCLLNLLCIANILYQYNINKYFNIFNLDKLDIKTQFLLYICVPFGEECIFRVTALKQFEYYIDTETAIHIISIGFGLLHITNILGFNGKRYAYLLILGQLPATIFLSYILFSTNSLLVSIMFHIYYNSVCATILIELNKSSHKICNVDFVKNSKKNLWLSKRRYSFSDSLNKLVFNDTHVYKQVSNKEYNDYNNDINKIGIYRFKDLLQK